VIGQLFETLIDLRGKRGVSISFIKGKEKIYLTKEGYLFLAPDFDINLDEPAFIQKSRNLMLTKPDAK
jgi:hypothetical protein